MDDDGIAVENSDIADHDLEIMICGALGPEMLDENKMGMRNRFF